MMTLLTGWQSLLARIGMVLLIAGSLVLFGWFKGHASEAKVFAAYRNQLALQAAVQTQHNADLIKQQRETSARIEGNYNAQIAALRTRSNADWMRYLTRPGSVPAISKSAQGFDAATPDALFIEHCAETTQQLVSLQGWISENKARSR